MALLDVKKLNVGYQTKKGFLKAVDDVSFSLDSGRSLGLVGESGCGKTTIGKAIMGLLPPNASVTGGNIFFQEKDLNAIPENEFRSIRWSKIAMIFQAAMNALNPVHKVGAQIGEAIKAHNSEMPAKEVSKNVEELFDLVGIPAERINDYPHQYSGGMKQRAVIAMALSCRPNLIIADEPTTALDVIVQDQILGEIKKLQDGFHIGIIYISHDISVVADICHNIAVMYAGQIIEIGRREEVFDNPVHPYTKALLASFPTLTGEKLRLEPIPGEAPNLVCVLKGCRFCDRCTTATDKCRNEPPPWVEITRTHKALCFG